MIPEPNTGCWLWLGETKGGGYPVIRERKTRKHVLVTRIILAMREGPLPSNIFACHKCDNPPCINPEHLFAGTNQDNVIDSVKKRRHWQSKKTECVNGHPYVSQNVRIDLHGKRVCLACKEQRALKAKTSSRGTGICAKGHAVTGENVNVSCGIKRCLACLKMNLARKTQRRKEARLQKEAADGR